MPLRNLVLESIDSTVDQRLRSLVRESGIPLRTFSDALGASTATALNWWSRGGAQLTVKNVNSLSQYFGISEDELSNHQKKLPVDLVRDRLFMGPQVLPEIYGHDASSFVRSSAHIIEYLAMVFGRHFVDRLLIQMNVHPHLFKDLDNKINLLFFMHLLNEVKRAGLTESEVESLACYVFLRIQQTPLGQEFSQAQNYQDCYAVLSQHAAMFDANFDYRFEIDRQAVEITATPTAGASFLSDNEPSDYERLFRYKRKLMGWFPTLSNLAPVNMTTPKCVSLGDSCTIYRFEIGTSPGFKPTYLKILSGRE